MHLFLQITGSFITFRAWKRIRMACSAIYFLDMKGKVLLHRNYRGDIENTVIDKFIGENLWLPSKH